MVNPTFRPAKLSAPFLLASSFGMLLIGSSCGPKTLQTNLSLTSGDYILVEAYRTEGDVGSVNAPIPQGITLQVRNHEIRMNGPNGEGFSASITKLPENQWLKDCPVGMSWDVSETHAIENGLNFAGFEIESALIYSRCPGKGRDVIHISPPNAPGQEQYCRPGPCLVFERKDAESTP